MGECDEALEIKAAKALLEARRLRWGSVHQGECITDARAVLDAVGPAIEAKALRGAADAIQAVRESGTLPDGMTSHPIVGDDWLHDRADQIAGEQPRTREVGAGGANGAADGHGQGQGAEERGETTEGDA